MLRRHKPGPATHFWLLKLNAARVQLQVSQTSILDSVTSTHSITFKKSVYSIDTMGYRLDEST